MSANRRGFLQHLALSSIAIGTLPSALRASEPDAAVLTLGEQVDEVDQQVQDWDTSWTSKLTAKYRAVFDVPEINGGIGVWRAGLWQNHYRDFRKTAPSDLNPVIVIRHTAIPLVMSQEFWETYEVSKNTKVTHPMTEESTTRNPVLMNAETDKLSATISAMTLDKQMERGAIVLGCNMAFVGMVSLVAKKDKLSNSEARTKALSMMLPGVIMQPNGIFGLTLAQENGCSFVAAS